MRKSIRSSCFFLFFLFKLLVLAFVSFSPATVSAAQVTLEWDENSEPDLVGYRIFCRQEGQDYDYYWPVWDGVETTCTIFSLDENATYYFVARAYDEDNESGNSNEVRYQPEDNDQPIDISPQIISDNGDAGASYTGTWKVSSGANPYGDKSLYSNEVNATYTFETELVGSYEVSLWWTYWSNRCTSVPVEIYDGETLLDTVEVNQKANGGKWNPLGPYVFRGTARVVIISEGGCTTSADAVRFLSALPPEPPEFDHIEIEGPHQFVNESSSTQYFCRAYYTDGANRLVDPESCEVDCTEYAEITRAGELETFDVDEDQQCQITMAYTEGGITRTAAFDITIRDFDAPTVIIDNDKPGTSYTGGPWGYSSGPNPYGGSSRTEMQQGAAYTFKAPISGSYEVSLWWTYWSSRCTNVPVDIYDGNTLLDTVRVNHQENGGQWNLLGAYFFSSGTARVVIRSESNSCSTCADAVRFEP